MSLPTLMQTINEIKVIMHALQKLAATLNLIFVYCFSIVPCLSVTCWSYCIELTQ